MNKSTLIVNVLEALPLITNIDAVYLYGSHATGKNSSSSDYDIAILFAPRCTPSFDQCLELLRKLEEALEADVDLLILNDANPIISMQAVTKGKLILDRNRSRRAFFVATLFSRYAELKEMRAPMEENILKRKYYG